MDLHPTTGVKYVDTSTTHKSESEVAQNESNDCVVRATASAFDIDYEKAHRYIGRHFGRRPRTGVYCFVDRIKQGGYEILEYDLNVELEDLTDTLGKKYYKSTDKLRVKTIGTFIKEGHKGNYLVVIRGHAFAIKDGEVHGNTCDARRLRARIQAIYRVNKK